MSSWFSQLSNSASEALEKLNDLSAQVQSSLPIDNDLVNKLILRSEDLKAVHDLIDAEETKKEVSRKLLPDLLPWDTKDEAKVIIIDECKTSILELSTSEISFTTPFALPSGIQLWRDSSNLLKVTDEHRAEVLKKFEKVPIPEFLSNDFDLEAHQRLIERLFKIDKNLVKMHSMLLNPAKTESVFWKNYFYNCALIRHSKGMDLNEIWKPLERSTKEEEMLSVSSVGDYEVLDDDLDKSIELTFEPEDIVVASQGHCKLDKSISDVENLDDLEAEIERELLDD